MTLAAEREAESEVVYPDPTPPVLGGFQGLPARPGWFSQHLGTAVIGAVLGYLLGHWLGNMVGSGYTNISNSGSNSIAVTGGLLLAVAGWLLGIGAVNYPLAKLVGMEPHPEYESTSWTRYLRYTADHKVVGLQYVIGVLGFFFTGGLLAMAIRTELLSPTSHVFGPGTYIAIVSEHGTMMTIMATCALLTLATPTLVAAGLFGILDHTAQTAFYVTEHGGSSFLWQNLFWFFGHPEVYIMALPGFGIVAELLPVFCRKPLFAYKVAAAGMVGVALLSFFVWQHHLFQSGINPDMRPLFMLTTELISIPTGFIYLVGLGTLYKAKIRFEVPMLFCLAVFFNFLIGGVTGVFLSDVPVNVTVHGSFFVLAHFHYTIMGGLIFAFFGGLYYWLPKMTGKTMNKQLGKAHFWTMFIFFNMTFFPMFLIGLLGQPRRVFEYAQNLQALNDFASVSAFLLGASFLIFIANFVWSIFIKPTPSPANPWDSLGLEWQTPTPVPYYNFERIPVILSDPYHYSEENAPAVADLGEGVLVGSGAPTSAGVADEPRPPAE